MNLPNFDRGIFKEITGIRAGVIEHERLLITS